MAAASRSASWRAWSASVSLATIAKEFGPSLIGIELGRNEDLQHGRELLCVQWVAEALPGAGVARDEPVPACGGALQREEHRRTGRKQVLVGERPAERVGVAVREVLVD